MCMGCRKHEVECREGGASVSVSVCVSVHSATLSETERKGFGRVKKEEELASDTHGNIFSLTSAPSRHPPLNNFMAILSPTDLCRRAGEKEWMAGEGGQKEERMNTKRKIIRRL